MKNFVFKIQGGNHAEKGMENSFIFIKVYHIYDKNYIFTVKLFIFTSKMDRDFSQFPFLSN